MARAISSIVTVTSFALRGLVGQPFPVATLGDRQAGAPALQVCSRESIASIFGGSRFLSQGMNDEADHCDTDAGIGDVEGRPGIGKANM